MVIKYTFLRGEHSRESAADLDDCKGFQFVLKSSSKEVFITFKTEQGKIGDVSLQVKNLEVRNIESSVDLTTKVSEDGKTVEITMTTSHEVVIVSENGAWRPVDKKEVFKIFLDDNGGYSLQAPQGYLVHSPAEFTLEEGIGILTPLE